MAANHPEGVVDLSVGTPVDPVPDVIRSALDKASNSPGYPATYGTLELRRSVVRWLRRRLDVTASDDAVLPAIGTKELVATLPLLLGLDGRSRVLVPELAYPTYEIGALLVGATIARSDSTVAAGPGRVDLVWLNSPANPTGKVLPVEHLRKVVQWARERGAIVASDECYVELGWDARPVSILHPEVCRGSHEGLLAFHSLSKRSNLAGYRAGFVVGDPLLIDTMLSARRHLGAMMPSPVQAAMVAALDDDDHVNVQRGRYAQRRDVLVRSLTAAGFEIEHSEGGLYLWASRDEECMTSVNWFAGHGILVAPGNFYGPAGSRHVRVALTASDDDVHKAAARLVVS
jgi:succinyldiaminopimelate transaminase